MNADKYSGGVPVRVFAEEVRLDVPLLSLPYGPEDVDRDGRFGVMRDATVLVAATPLEQSDNLVRRDLTRVKEVLPLDNLADFVLVIPGQERPDHALSGFAKPHSNHIVRQSAYGSKRF